MSTDTDLKSAALAYAEDGWRVFPCWPGQKTPMTTRGWQDATSDAEQIAAWWDSTPDANIGLALHDSGVAVVDLDPPAMEAGTVDRFSDPTWTVRTPRGGLHLYYEGDLASSAGRLGHGIDTRGRGGYVLAPPSRTSAGAYTVEDDRPPQPLPTWISAELDRGKPVVKPALPHQPDDPANRVRAEEWTRRQPLPVPGHGANDALYRVAAHWRDLGLSVETAITCIVEWSGLAATVEAAQVVRNAYAYAQNEPGAHATAPAVETFGDAIPPPEPVRNMSTISAIPFARLLAEPAEPVQELVEGLIERGCLNLLSAPGDSFKSWVALQTAVSVALGRPMWGRSVMQTPVLHLSYEDGAAEVARRLHAMTARMRLTGPERADGLASAAWFCDARAHNLGPIFLIGEDGPREGPALPQVRRLVAEQRAAQREAGNEGADHTLLVLDSAYNVLRFAERMRLSEDAVNAAIQSLDNLCGELGATMLALYHPTRAGAQRGDAGNSTAWDSAPRVRLGLRRDDDGETITLAVEKRNHAPRGAPIPLLWGGGLLRARGADAEGLRGDPRPTGSMPLDEAVIGVAAMAAEHGAPLKKRGAVEGWILAEIMQRTGRKVGGKALSEALARGVAAGRLRYHDNPRGARVNEPAGYYPADIA